MTFRLPNVSPPRSPGWRASTTCGAFGRQGLYLHNNTHHSLLMGYRAAEAILVNARARWPAALAEFSTFRVAD